jgi:hypothetical protein
MEGWTFLSDGAFALVAVDISLSISECKASISSKIRHSFAKIAK